MAAPKKPVSPEAFVGLLLSLAAVALALFGVFSPWGALRFPLTPKLSGTDAVLAYGATCVLPIPLGLGAGWLGGQAYRRIEISQGAVGGDGLAFFSIMIGLFAVIIGAVTTFAALVWPRL